MSSSEPSIPDGGRWSHAPRDVRPDVLVEEHVLVDQVGPSRPGGSRRRRWPPRPGAANVGSASNCACTASSPRVAVAAVMVPSLTSSARSSTSAPPSPGGGKGRGPNVSLRAAPVRGDRAAPQSACWARTPRPRRSFSERAADPRGVEGESPRVRSVPGPRYRIRSKWWPLRMVARALNLATCELPGGDGVGLVEPHRGGNRVPELARRRPRRRSLPSPWSGHRPPSRRPGGC